MTFSWLKAAIKRLFFGAPRDISDKSIFHRLALIPLQIMREPKAETGGHCRRVAAKLRFLWSEGWPIVDHGNPKGNVP